jgi:hypothetical protein
MPETTVTGLASGESYDFRVKALGDGTTWSDSDYTAPVTAETAEPVPVLDAPVYAGFQFNQQRVLAVRWASDAPATDVAWTWSDSGGSTDFGTMTASAAGLFTVADGDWTASATSTTTATATDSTSAWADSPTASEDIAIPAPYPAPTAPVVSDQTGTAATFTTSDPGNVDRWVFRLMDAGGTLISEQVTSSNSMTWSGLTAGTTYQVAAWVLTIALNPAGSPGLLSAATTFTAQAQLAAPVYTSFEFQERSLVTRWSGIDANATNLAWTFAAPGSLGASGTLIRTGATALFTVNDTVWVADEDNTATLQATDSTATRLDSGVTSQVIAVPAPLATPDAPVVSNLAATSATFTTSSPVGANLWGFRLLTPIGIMIDEFTDTVPTLDWTGLESGTSYQVVAWASITGTGPTAAPSALSAATSFTTP